MITKEKVLSQTEAPAYALVRKVAARTMRLNFQMWRFGESIALRGLMRSSEATGDLQPFAYSLALLRAYAASGVGRSSVEHVAPAAELLMAYKATGDATFLEAARKRASLHASCPQNALGARLHRTDLSGWERQIWVDCMDIDSPFLAQMGAVTGEEHYFDRSAEEALSYCLCLQDEKTGLFYHGFEENCGRNGQLWARGNGWALMGMAETLRFLPRGHQRHHELHQRLHAQCQGLAKCQHARGLWHTLLDKEDSYLESTLATMVAFAMREAFNAKLLDERDFGAMELQARRGAMDLIGEDGELTRVSVATPVGEPKMYASRPFGVFPWGQGALLLMISQSAT